ncbi:PREDICTED: nuclear speckle splicing regulatory protein 1-like [Tarenaya hassleriana]|uniref:nuclear speckle splicing regulatory protein 1-like n=1 Tax=Tarenaya hassleriana TaxID=28532 RepID=UPI00053C2673|nr:PREDICTED: nuclear speckle splicing regulatory protein 1-like [Tarenaya hassleriana]
MKKYGLQLRVPPSQKKQPATRPPLPTAPIFRDDDDDDVEKEIIRQGSKNKALKEIEEQHKKALEEDPSAFSYDEVYDDMKQKEVLPRMQDHEERKPRYIQHLMQQADRRKKEQEIVYERKLSKERSKDEHLYADKDKFITGAYRRKLEEQQKWMEEERLRELREEKEDVTKKKDLSDFYFNLGKNVAFGSKEAEAREAREAKRLEEQRKAEKPEELRKGKVSEEKETDALDKNPSPEPAIAHPEPSSAGNISSGAEPQDSKQAAEKRSSAAAPEPKDSSVIEPKNDEPKPSSHHKRSEDAITAAKERFLARKKAKAPY